MSEQPSVAVEVGEEQYTQLMAEARRSGRSIHEVVGEAVESHLQHLAKKGAIESLLKAPAVEMGTWEEEKAVMLDEISRLDEYESWEPPTHGA